MDIDSNLIATCQKAYLAEAVKSAGDDFLMVFDEHAVIESVFTTKAFLDLSIALYGSYIDPIKAFKKPLIVDGLMTETHDEWFCFECRLTDKGVNFLESLNNIEIIYN